MATIYQQRSSAVRAAKKACSPDQEWVISQQDGGFIYTILDLEAEQGAAIMGQLVSNLKHQPVERKAASRAACKLGDEAIAANLADPASDVVIKLKIADKPVSQRPAVGRDLSKPWQRAKAIICDCVQRGITSRKEIIAHCMAQDIKYNTADGAHYEMCVKGKRS